MCRSQISTCTEIRVAPARIGLDWVSETHAAWLWWPHCQKTHPRDADGNSVAVGLWMISAWPVQQPSETVNICIQFPQMMKLRFYYCLRCWVPSHALFEPARLRKEEANTWFVSLLCFVYWCLGWKWVKQEGLCMAKRSIDQDVELDNLASVSSMVYIHIYIYIYILYTYIYICIYIYIHMRVCVRVCFWLKDLCQALPDAN